MRISALLFAAVTPLSLACHSGPSTPGSESLSAPEPVLTHTFTGPDLVRVTLNGGDVYRVDLDSRGLRIALTPLRPGTPPPLIQDVVPGTSASGDAAYEIRPSADGEYELSVVGGQQTGSVNLTLTRIAAAKHPAH